MKNCLENQSTMKGVTISEGNSHEHQQQQQDKTKKKKKKNIKLSLLVVNVILLSVGQVGGPVLIRLYYLHGGQRKWLSSWLQTAAFPLILIPILVSWSKSKSKSHSQPISAIDDVKPTVRFGVTSPKLFGSCVILGVMFGLDSFLFTIGLSYLPVSTAALLMSTQLAFIAAFAFIIVKQKFTPYSINSVVLLTLGSVVLAFHTDGDRPIGVSKDQYLLGFFATLGAGALIGLMLPFIEFVYTKTCEAITYDLVMHMQFLISMFATIICTIAMLINKDFQGISREAKQYGLGETNYYMVLIFTAVCMLCGIIGNFGIIFCSTSLVSGVLITMLIPIQQIFAIFIFNEKFSAEKGMSLALSIWGFASYFYGEYKQTEKNKQYQHESPITHHEIPSEV